MNNYFKNIWLGVYTALIGMSITLRHLFVRNVTIQYPQERLPIPDNARNRLFLDYDLCNGCQQCARACPVNCIIVETIKTTPGDTIPPLKDGSKRALWVPKYDIDFAKCCFCSLCTEPCPTEAIKMTPEFEYTKYNRNGLIYSFSMMTEQEAVEKKEMYEKFAVEKKRKEAEAKATAELKQATETKNNE